MNIISIRTPSLISGLPKIYEVQKGTWFNQNEDKTGFIVGEFDPGIPPLFYEIKRELDFIPEEVVTQNRKNFNFDFYSESQYGQYINYIKKVIGTHDEWKIVASRRSLLKLSITPYNVFKSLCAAYPDAYVFFISTKDFGTWIGASPELLLKRESNFFYSMALAGTRRGDTIEKEWDLKNLKEQEIVTDFIARIFKKHSLEVEVGQKSNKKAGYIEHLMTPISGKEVNYETNVPLKASVITNLLRDLSPTPALSGFPRDLALDVIKKFEGDRKLYGGYCGLVEPSGDFMLNVILRCAFLESLNSAILFAGGGITRLSVAEDEWDETRRKMETLLRFM